MANEFIARNGLIAQNNSTVTGSLTVTQGITGSLFGTASYASTLGGLDSSSFAVLTANRFNGNQTIGTNGGANLTIQSATFGSASLDLIASSGGGAVVNLTSTTFAPDAIINSTFSTGDLVLKVSGSEKVRITPAGATNITGSLNVSQGITGSLFGSATTASYAATASILNPLNQTVNITGSLLVGTGSSIAGLAYGFIPNMTIGMNTGSTGAVLYLRNTSGSIVAGSTLGTIQFAGTGDGTGMYASSQIRATITQPAGSGNSGGGNIAISTSPPNTGERPVERMRVNSNGQVLVGLTSSLDTTSKLIVNGNTVITGSLNATQGITGSLLGTASFATTASYAVSAGTAFGLVQAFSVGLQNMF